MYDFDASEENALVTFYSNYQSDQIYQQQESEHPIQESEKNVKKTTNTSRNSNDSKNEKVDYKNLPKLIGNNFQRYIEQNKNTLPMSKGVRDFMQPREKNSEKKSKVNPKQLSTKISELRDICATDKQSQKTFKSYIKKQLMIDIIQSPKIEDPMKYIEGIKIYFAASKEPEKMISSKLQFNSSSH